LGFGDGQDIVVAAGTLNIWLLDAYPSTEAEPIGAESTILLGEVVTIYFSVGKRPVNECSRRSKLDTVV
jgi:hypothetical protein